jgi:hypothetical protein
MFQAAPRGGFFMMATLFRWGVLAGVLLLSACASLRAPAPPAGESAWQPVLLPGKRATSYRPDVKDGRSCVAALADRSASLWRRAVTVPAHAVGEVEFSWRVDKLMPTASLQDAERSDAPARVVFSFAGDHDRLSPRNRALFDLAQVLTGEAPPYATLMYVWDAEAPEGSVIVNARSDRIRKIVVESGPRHLRQWRHYRRDLATDFQRAFGEAPGALLGVALMTDSDNTGSRAEAWYGDIKIH